MVVYSYRIAIIFVKSSILLVLVSGFWFENPSHRFSSVVDVVMMTLHDV
jgi:hypothetical protein